MLCYLGIDSDKCMSNKRDIKQAFILGAGLGTRLQPLTNALPKPLIPFFHEPLIVHSIRKCQALGIKDIMINTHYLPDLWQQYFPDNAWEDCKLSFRYEEDLLDSGGGLKNIQDWVNPDSELLVLNGDIVSNFPLKKLIDAHINQPNAEVTLALRNTEGKKNVGFDENTSLVTDMRHLLNRDSGSWQFASAYCAHSSFLDRIPTNQIVSVVPYFIELIVENKLYGVNCNGGYWMDLGTQESYVAVHQLLKQENTLVHPCSVVHETAHITDTIVGNNAQIDHHCQLNNCIVWPNVSVPANTTAENEIFYR